MYILSIGYISGIFRNFIFLRFLIKCTVRELVMRINPNISFKGTFYTVADSHTRLPMTAGLLTQIEEKSKKGKRTRILT